MDLTPAYLQQQLQQFPRVSRYHVAFSGGCDSLVLLHLLAQLHQQQPLELHAIHIHHGLQQQADQWATHCQRVCEQLSIPITIEYVDIDHCGKGIEAAAREARYSVFKHLLGEGEGLLLAHHQDDQAETLMLQLLRGAGVTGLAAMPAQARFGKGWLLRPLLDCSRQQLENYAREQELDWIEDPSNRDTRFDRNFLRQEVMPLLASRWPAVKPVLSRVAAHQAEAMGLLQELAELDWQQCRDRDNTLSIAAMNNLGMTRQRNLVRYWVKQLHGFEAPDSKHLARIMNEVIPAAGDAMPEVCWGNVEVRRYRGLLFVSGSRAAIPEQALPWDARSSIQVNEEISLKAESLEGMGLKLAEIENHTLTIRFRQGGEVCRPAGRQHHHSLKKLMQEWGIPPWLRDRVPLIYLDDELAQVVGHCLCEPFVATGKEKGVLVSKTVT